MGELGLGFGLDGGRRVARGMVGEDGGDSVWILKVCRRNPRCLDKPCACSDNSSGYVTNEYRSWTDR